MVRGCSGEGLASTGPRMPGQEQFSEGAASWSSSTKDDVDSVTWRSLMNLSNAGRQMRPNPWHFFHGAAATSSCLLFSCFVLNPRVHSPHGGCGGFKNTPGSPCAQISSAFLPSHRHPYCGLPLWMPSGLCPIPVRSLGPCAEQDTCSKLLGPTELPSGLSTSTWGTPTAHALTPSPGSPLLLHLWANCLLKKGP